VGREDIAEGAAAAPTDPRAGAAHHLPQNEKISLQQGVRATSSFMFSGKKP